MSEPVVNPEIAVRGVSSARALPLGVRAADGAVALYQKILSPALSVAAPFCGCRFAPTCSHYAREALREHGLLPGLALAATRVVKCGPWHPGGIDPVPPKPATAPIFHG